MTTNVTEATRQDIAPRPRWKRTAATTATALAAAAGLWVLAVPIAGVDLAVDSAGGTREIVLADALLAGGVAALTGAASRWVLARWNSRGRTVWTGLAVGVLVLSLGGPLSATSSAAWLTLTCMHVVVGLVVIMGLRRWTDG